MPAPRPECIAAGRLLRDSLVVGRGLDVQDELVHDVLDLLVQKLGVIHHGMLAMAEGRLEELGVNGVAQDGAEVEEAESEDERVLPRPHGAEAGGGHVRHFVQRDGPAGLPQPAQLSRVQPGGQQKFHPSSVRLPGERVALTPMMTMKLSGTLEAAEAQLRTGRHLINN